MVRSSRRMRILVVQTALTEFGNMQLSLRMLSIGDGAAFINGRDFAAWLGLVPKQISTGGGTILGGIRLPCEVLHYLLDP